MAILNLSSVCVSTCSGRVDEEYLETNSDNGVCLPHRQKYSSSCAISTKGFVPIKGMMRAVFTSWPITLFSIQVNSEICKDI